MKLIQKITVAALMAGALTFAGCQRTTEGVQDDANRAGENMRDFGRDANQELDEGTGGAGRDGLDIGDNEGVLNDGEGPLENEETRPGDNPGVINDGEGPIEENF